MDRIGQEESSFEFSRRCLERGDMEAEFFVTMAILITLVGVALIPRVRRLVAAGLRMALVWVGHCLVAGLAALCDALWEQERSGAAKLNPPRQRYQR